VERKVQIDPALKAWLDRAIIPALVRQYLAIRRDVDDNGSSAIHREDSNPSSAENVQ
jgi:hypothetical protein